MPVLAAERITSETEFGFPLLTARASEEVMNTDQVFACAPVAMALVDERGGFAAINPALLQMLGFTSGDLEAQTLAAMVDPDDRYQVRMPLEPRSWDCHVRTKFGTPRPVRMSVSRMMNVQGTLFVVAFWDLTEFKSANERLGQANAALIRANAELENFSLMAAHDLQEPLRMVSAYAEQLARLQEANVDPACRNFLSYIVDGAKRMQSLVRELLAYARFGKEAQSDIATDANEALAAALSNLRTAVDDSGARVLCAGLPVVRCDRRQLMQLFQNLIGNAIKYRGDQPPLVHVSALDLGSHWQFSVRDNGIGIPLEHHHRIFNPFTRVAEGTKDGDGIGLALCHRIVRGHQGSIWVESEPGCGATFCFTLPK